MSSSSDIEKLFDHFGGDANAYQEIGRENEARSARTRWPLLVTLDLSQPAIPAIGQQRAARPQAPVAATQADDASGVAASADTTPKDAASVTRAKAPLFTRSHRRDIPPVVTPVAQPATPRGASRFGDFDALDTLAKIDAVTQGMPAAARGDAAAAQSANQSATQPAAPAAAHNAASSQQAAAPIAPQPVQATPPAIPPVQQAGPVASVAPIAPIAPVTPVAPAAPVASIAQPAAPASASAFAALARAPASAVPPAVRVPFHAAAAQPAPPAQPAAQPWTQPQTSSTTPSWLQARAQTPSPAPAPAAPAAPASILGKLFATQSTASRQPAPAASTGSAPLQSVFDRLRGTPAQPVAAPAGAPRAAALAPSNSWLVNGPRRS
ncbi:cellulose biosynthesis protein BcsP [Paraburkholderia sp. D15]|uniref:cellulose biosynthesis protein BcsP n=1 Tax=Paraburkholderia sp. D15 TaxID=2880218 RepID=UPI00247986BC|nr:cellulose biosynthesis protein BcsP [Paraburkholderia sp. D15]WGS53744.1 cellulose biosynthesis protein BcsP [Paraburkholderia sp. D15]